MLPSTQDAYTQAPNWLFDLMPDIPHAAFKVAMALARLTFGWWEEWTEANTRQVAEMTGISRSTVIDHLAWLVNAGVVERAPMANNAYRYRLVKRSEIRIAQDKRSYSGIASDPKTGSV